METFIRENTDIETNDPVMTWSEEERQVNPQIVGPFPAKVQGVDASGIAFEFQTALDKLSATDFYLRVARCIEPGAQLFVLARVYKATIELRGTVFRVDTLTDGVCDLAVSIEDYKISSE